MKENQIEKISKEYASLNKSIDSFGIELLKQIQQILNDNSIHLGFPIQHRTKNWPSIKRKLNLIRIKSLLDIQDLCGLRLVLLFKRDIESVRKIISENFDILKEYDTINRLDSNQFGYSSFHMIVKMPGSWFELPTLKGFSNLKAEIQIRTLSQHTWAAASHVLQYQSEENVPKTILRSVYRVSAILETVDIEFERFLDERDKYLSQIDKLSSKEISKTSLNVDLLEKVMVEKLPNKNKSKDEEYSDLLDDLRFMNIADTSQFIELVDQHLNKAIERDNKASDNIEDDHYFNHTGLIRICLQASNPLKYEKLAELWKKDKNSS